MVPLYNVLVRCAWASTAKLPAQAYTLRSTPFQSIPPDQGHRAVHVATLITTACPGTSAPQVSGAMAVHPGAATGTVFLAAEPHHCQDMVAQAIPSVSPCSCGSSSSTRPSVSAFDQQAAWASNATRLICRCSLLSIRSYLAKTFMTITLVLHACLM